MGEIRGFLEYERKDEDTILPQDRIKNYNEFQKELPTEELKKQGGRCMDCGIPFCHSGCPLGNLIPDFKAGVLCDSLEGDTIAATHVDAFVIGHSSIVAVVL